MLVDVLRTLTCSVSLGLLFILLFIVLAHSPMPLWLTTGRPPHDPTTPVGVLTEEEFNNLPEIIYEGTPEKGDSDTDNDEDGEEEEEINANELSTAEVKSGTEDNSVTGSSAAASEVDVEVGASIRGTQADEGEVSTGDVSLDGSKSETQAVESDSQAENIPTEAMDDDDFLKDKKDSAEEGPDTASNDGDFLETSESGTEHDKGETEMEDTQIISSEPDEETRHTAVHETETDKVVVIEGNQSVADSAAAKEKDEDADDTALDLVPQEQAVGSSNGTAEGPAKTIVADPSANEIQSGDSISELSPEDRGSTIQTTEQGEGEGTSQGDRQTTSTACAICIDEFETGERRTLLPKC